MPATAMISEWGKVLNALGAHLRNQVIKGIPLDKLKIQKLPFDLRAMAIGSFLTPARDMFSPRTNLSDNWTFKNQLTWIVASNGDIDDEAAIDEFLMARQRVIEALLPTLGPVIRGYNSAYDLAIEPGPVYDVAAFKQNYDAQAILINVTISKQRQRPANS